MEETQEKSLAEITADKIINMIIEEQYEQQQKLPTEVELAQKLNVGRNTVREAIKLLTAKNIVEARRGSGIFVSKLNGVPKDPFGFLFLKNKEKTAKDLMEIRYLIEPHIAMLAAQYATKEEIEDLEKACQLVKNSIAKGQDHGKADMKFHEQIAKCSRNEIMSQLVPIINYSIMVFIDMTNNTLEQETMKAHDAILEAIKNKDCIKAHDEMMIHLIIIRKTIENKIENNKKT